MSWDTKQAPLWRHLGKQRAVWKGLWLATDTKPGLSEIVFPPVKLLSRPEPSQLVLAAKCFKKNTVTPGGLHPKHVGDLCEPGLVAFGWLLWLFEFFGAFPESIAAVWVSLYPKAAAGVRPIGGYHAEARVWQKLRKPSSLRRNA